MLTIIAIGAVVLFVAALAFAVRRRRVMNRAANLGVVSQQWLVVHRAEDR